MGASVVAATVCSPVKPWIVASRRKRCISGCFSLSCLPCLFLSIRMGFLVSKPCSTSFATEHEGDTARVSSISLMKLSRGLLFDFDLSNRWNQHRAPRFAQSKLTQITPTNKGDCLRLSSLVRIARGCNSQPLLHTPIPKVSRLCSRGEKARL